jgi:hypothetical protein
VKRRRSLRHAAQPRHGQENWEIDQQISVHKICFSDSTHLDNSFFLMRDSG